MRALEAAVAAAKEELKRELKGELMGELKGELQELKSAGQLTFTTAALGQVYHDALTAQVLQQVPLPTWFAPDPAAPALAWSKLLPGAKEADVQ